MLFSSILKNPFKYLVLLGYVVLLILPAKSQKTYSLGHQVNFKHYSNEEGFFSAYVRSIFQDSKGRIWISSQEGLSVFNGHSFYNFSAKDKFGYYDIGSVCEDNYGGIWVGSNRGIYIYKSNKFMKLDTIHFQAPKSISWCLFKDVDGSIWAGTQQGIFHFNPAKLDKPLIKHYSLPGNKSSNSVRLIKRKNNGRLLIGTDNGFFYYKPDTFYNPCKAENEFYSHIEFENNKEWFCGFGRSITQYRNNKPDSTINVGSFVLSMTKDKEGHVWIVTWDNGVFKYNGKDLIHYSFKEGLECNSFWSCLTDKEGNVWLGSCSNVFYKYSGELFSSITEKNNLFSNNVNALAQDTCGNTWISSENSISCFDPKLNSITNYTSCNHVALSLIQTILVNKNNEVLALKYGGNGYKISNHNITSEPWLGGFSAIEGDSGEYYFGQEKTLQKVNKDKTVTDVAGKRKPMNGVMNIYRDKNKHFWLMNSFIGINYYTGKNEFFFNRKNGFTSSAATCIYPENNGNLWIGTRGKGIYKCKLINDSTMQILDSITSVHGLNSDLVNSVVIFDNNMLIGTAYGLGVLNMADYQRGVKRVKTYNTDEGLVNTNCTISFIDKKGKAWIKTNKGVFIFDETALVFNSTETTTFIQTIELFHEPVDWSELGFSINKDGLPNNLRLPYNKNHLTFNFIGICQASPHKVLYQYMLVGSDKNWSPMSTNNEAVYSNIPSGTYTFMVKSCNNDGIWNKIPVAFTFTITPPFWKQVWFYFTLICLVLSAIYYFIKFRERKLKQENDLLENKINERTQQLKIAFLEIEEKNKDITDSINYAKRIQEAILPAKELKHELFPNSFVLYQPRDIVSGDFYWFAGINGKRLIAAVDCTGHGVPGAFMSLIGSTILNELVNVKGITKPGEILSRLRDQIIISLKQTDGNNKDGMDISLLSFDDKNNTVEFAGANNPLWIIRNGEYIEVKADKQPVGYFSGELKSFTNHKIELIKDDILYIFTDGFADQFGGDKGKKYKYSHLKTFLLAHQFTKIDEQEKKLLDEFNKWRGSLEQVDDICIIGIKI